MSKTEEILCLLELQRDIVQNGKIEKEKDDHSPFACNKDRERLKKYHFFELQNKYTYGWYIAMEETVEAQVASICKFIQFIVENYTEVK